jgi:hypothetical protein
MRNLRDLISKGRNTLAALGVVGALAFGYQNASAQSVSDPALLSIFKTFGLSSESQSDRQLAEYFLGWGMMDREMEIAKAGRNQIIINNQIYTLPNGYVFDNSQNPEDFRIRPPKREFFTFGRINDRNRDRLLASDEMEDIKDLFTTDESINICFNYETGEDVKGKKFYLRVFDENGRQTYPTSSLINPYPDAYWLASGGANIENPGRYTFEVYDENDQLLMSKTIRVVAAEKKE